MPNNSATLLEDNVGQQTGEQIKARSLQQLSYLNDTERHYPQNLLLHQLFERQANRTPNETAVVFEGSGLTYGELNARSNKLARYLRGLGVKRDKLVGICAERSLEMVIGLLGILKAGGAYVPFDPGYPKDRLSFMVSDAQAPVLLTQKHLTGILPEHKGMTVCLDQDWQKIDRELDCDLDPVGNPESLAYVIYTSGSTGTPKGVMNTHRGIVNRLFWGQEEYPIDTSDRVLQKTPFSFDISVWEFFWPLMTGARLIVAKPDGHRDAAYLCRLIKTEQITTLHFVPSMLQVFLREADYRLLSSLRRVICSGEALSTSLKDQCLESIDAELLNLYGPTEAAVEVTHFRCTPGGTTVATPIGRPIANTQLFVLNDDMEPAQFGTAGELHIGGVSLARGYWNRADLTDQKFVANPFSTAPGARLYKTGDLVRYLSDGNIEFLGRLDNQVKLRGFRIELGEIETAIGSFSSVDECVVILREDSPGDQRLAAYLVACRGQAIDVALLRSFLRDKLPAYMAPSVFVVLDSIPLTPNGKMDRRALPAPEISDFLSTAYEAPRTATEELLCGIWGDILRLDRVGVRDNFFDLGGHSLLATQVISRLRKALERDVPLRLLFESPTPAELASVLDLHFDEAGSKPKRPANFNESSVIPGAAGRLSFPLSSAQQRLWFVHQWKPESPLYNNPILLRLTGKLHADALQKALNALVQRHQVFRTSFQLESKGPVQKVVEASDVSLARVEAAGSDWVLEEACRPFDLKSGLLLRPALQSMGGEDHLLLLNMPHLIYDGWSLHILLRDLSTLYGASLRGADVELPDLKIQYGDYAAWQQTRLSAGDMQGHLKYWKQQLAGMPESCSFFTDFPRSPAQSFRGARIPLRLSNALCSALQKIAQREDATLYMVLLAVFKALILRYSGQTDIVIGTPIAGREQMETEELIGCFINTLVLRTDLSDVQGFCDLLRRVRQTCLEAYEHQELPFERLVEELQPDRDLSRSPLFQVMLVLQNAPHRAAKFEGLICKAEEVHTETSKFDLVVNLEADDDGIGGEIEFSTDLFEPATIERLVGHFQSFLEGIAADPDRGILEVPLLGNQERHTLQTEWNTALNPGAAGSCLHHRFEAQAAETPEAAAVICGDETLTYAALNSRANQLACHLQSLGVGQETLVGVFTKRSLDMLVAIFGVLKAGAAYVPLDPSYPADRIAFMLEDTAVTVLLTQEDLLDRLPAHSAQTVCLDRVKDWGLEGASDNAICRANSSNLAYIIYTSGSTGRPKGVAIEHRSAVAFVDWALTVYSCEDVAVTLASASLCFDFSIFELFVPLSTGGAVRLVENALSLQCDGAAEDVTFVNMVPSAMTELVRENKIPKLARVVNLGGEALPPKLAQQLFNQTTVQRVVNIYGPTECTVCATSFTVAGGVEDAPPIGRPISGTQVYVLDGLRNLAPIGVPGELYIGGAGLARGYLNREELTAEKFVPDPFSTDPKARLYRTGDLVRWRADGNLEFLGRLDHQVKVRGYRIELGEIEAVITEQSSVQECVVIVREDNPGDQRLVAYLVLAPDQSIDVQELRAAVRRKLPEYMVPWYIVIMESLPATATGKRDRKLLPEPSLSSFVGETGFREPEDSLEEALCRIWTDLLKLETIGVLDNFFDLGGHSLLAIQLLSRVQREFTTVLSLAEMFKAPTVRSMAQLVRSKRLGEAVWSPMITLQASGSHPPLFCAPVGGGSAFFYQTMTAHLQAERPIYGFEPVGMNGVDKPHDTVEGMAAYYVRHMRIVQPNGPYYLCGLSFGGMVAFEMARQLVAEGESVGCLIMFDTHAPGYAHARRYKREGGMRGIVHHLQYKISSYKEDFLVRPALSTRVDYIYSRLGKLKRRVRDNAAGKRRSLYSENPTRLELPEEYERVRRAEEHSRQHYRPECYDGPVYLLRARLQEPGALIDPRLGWADFAVDLRVIETPGTHTSMLEDPCVHVAAGHVMRIMEDSARVRQRA